MASRALRMALVLFVSLPLFGSSQQIKRERQEPLIEARQLLEELAPAHADPCGPPFDREGEHDMIEFDLAQAVGDVFTDRLNAPDLSSLASRERVAHAAKQLEDLSAQIDASWPKNAQLHFDILDLSPALVVKWSIRARAGFLVLGVPREDNPKGQWQEVGSDDETTPDSTASWADLELYPLYRGPSGNARFLALFTEGGCAGSYGIQYDAREWDPATIGGLQQIINQKGSCGLEDGCAGGKPTPKDPFSPIGKLQTTGPRITLPYCQFTAIDSWDNPSLCSLDTYDLSGDSVKFVSREYNRPDLVPVAKTVEYAQQHDYPAVLAYCASAGVARKLVREIPPFVFASAELQVTREGVGRERVRLGDSGYSFDVEELGGRWVVAEFSE